MEASVTNLVRARNHHRVASACDRLGRELVDGVAWDQLIAALVDDARIDEAFRGLELAADAGLVTAERYVRFVHHLRHRRQPELAHVVAMLCCVRFPDTASAWMTVGYLCLERGDEARAERAYLIAERCAA